MAQEIEVKLRVDEHETVRQRLRERSATLMGRVLETNVILDRADGSLRGDGCGLRVRSAVAQTDGTTIATVTFKGRVVPSRFKSRTELEIAVDNADTAIAMLDALGFHRVLTYEKRRESWRLGSCCVELDEPPHIGLFVEIEGPSDRDITAVRRDLGLDDACEERASYVRMLSDYCARQGLVDRRVAFPESNQAG